MLIKFFPEQIVKHWDEIKMAIENALPPIAGDSPNRMNNILEELLMDRMQCWVAVNKNGRINGIGTTQLIEDHLTETKNLLVYSAFSIGVTTKEDWIRGFEVITKYAKSKGCKNIVGYTNNPKVVENMNKFGMDTSNVYFSMPLVIK